MSTSPFQKPEPNKLSKRTASLIFIAVVPMYLLVGFVLLPFFTKSEPEPLPERTQFIFQNQTDEARFTLRYTIQPPGDAEAVKGVIIDDRVLEKGSALEGIVARGFPEGTSVTLYGSRRTAESETLEVIEPLVLTLDGQTDSILFAYSINAERGWKGLWLPMAAARKGE